MQKLLENGISSRRRIMTAHQESAYKKRKINLPFSEKLRDNSIVIPLYNDLRDKQSIKIINIIKNLLS